MPTRCIKLISGRHFIIPVTWHLHITYITRVSFSQTESQSHSSLNTVPLFKGEYRSNTSNLYLLCKERDFASSRALFSISILADTVVFRSTGLSGIGHHACCDGFAHLHHWRGNPRCSPPNFFWQAGIPHPTTRFHTPVSIYKTDFQAQEIIFTSCWAWSCKALCHCVVQILCWKLAEWGIPPTKRPFAEHLPW